MNTIKIIWGKDLASYQEKYEFYKVIDYADSSYTGNIDIKKSITGYYFFLRGAITTLYSKQQQTI